MTSTDATPRARPELGAAAFRCAPVAAVLVTAGVVVDVNDAAARLVGRPRAELTGMALGELVGAGDQEGSDAWSGSSNHDDRSAVRVAATVVAADGQEMAVEVLLAPIDDVSVVVQLIPERDSVTARALRSEREFRSAILELHLLAHGVVDDAQFYAALIERAVAVIPGAQAGSVLVRRPGTRQYEFVATVGFELAELQRFPIYEHELYRDDADPRARIVVDYPTPGEITDERMRWWFESCRIAEIAASVAAPVHLDGRPVAMVSVDNFDDRDAFDATSVEMTTVLGRLIADLTTRRALEAELRDERAAYLHQATHDELTGLANRRHVERALDDLIAHCDVRAGLAVLFVDLDDFKRVNDEHGHDAGDEVLVAVGSQLVDAVRSSDIVARWGGDEFVVLTPGVDRETADELARRMVRRCAVDLELSNGAVVARGVTVGVAWAPSPASTAELFRAADAALYRAKAAGKGRHDLVTL